MSSLLFTTQQRKLAGALRTLLSKLVPLYALASIQLQYFTTKLLQLGIPEARHVFALQQLLGVQASQFASALPKQAALWQQIKQD